MKIDLKLQNGSAAGDHQIELTPLAKGPAAGGRLQFALDGESGEADWAEIEPGVYSILMGGRSHEVRVAALRSEAGSVPLYDVNIGPRTYHLEVRDPRRRRRLGPEQGHEGPQEILAPMPGKIVRVLVAEKQQVELNQGLLVIEAMKMQNELRAPRTGRVEKIYVTEGTGVEAGFKLLRLI